jgi:hypothetical protein
MSVIRTMFDVFSRRGGAKGKTEHEVPQSTRNRVVLWCQNVFSNRREEARGPDYTASFWGDMHEHLRLLKGTLQLCTMRVLTPLPPAADVLGFLSTCSGEDFLDFLECIFKARCLSDIRIPAKKLVRELNDLLQVDGLPYHVTDFTEVENWDEEEHGYARHTIEVVAYPHVVMRENEAMHSEAVAPALALLACPKFAAANREYLEGLAHYRKGEYGDCLTKIGSCFESVMKIVCDSRGWKYAQEDTAQKLLEIVMSNTRLEGYFAQPLMIIATLRNRLSNAHGAGTMTRDLPKHIAQYALNATAAAVLLLVQEAGEQ